MRYVPQVAGYVALLVTPAALLVQTLLASGVPVRTLGLGGGILLGGGATAAVQRTDIHDHPDRQDRRTALGTVAVVAVSAALTYVLSVHAGLGPVVAAAAVGVTAGLGAPEVDTAAYCGSFVGMASPAVFAGVGGITLAGLVTGLAFVATRETFSGFGGKLGTLALFGCLTAGLMTGAASGGAAPSQWGTALVAVPTAVVGAVAAVVLSVRYDLGAVLGSAVVGLVAGLALPTLLPDTGELLATVAFCASFVGMSSTERLATERHVAVAGALCGVVFVAVTPAFVGAGGKLGTTAFIACITLFGAERIRERVPALAGDG